MAKSNLTEFRKFCEKEMLENMESYDLTDIVCCCTELYKKFLKTQQKGKDSSESVISLKPNKKLLAEHGTFSMTEKEASLTPQDIKKRKGKRNDK